MAVGQAVRVVVVARHTRFRQELVALLGVGGRCDVGGACEDVGGAMALARRQPPDVVVLDADVLPPDGSELRHLLAAVPASRVLVLSWSAVDGGPARWARLGVRTLPKEAGPETLVDAVVALAPAAGAAPRAAAPARSLPADLAAYRAGQVDALAAGPAEQDALLVEMTLLVDRGDQGTGGRWQPRDERFNSLAAVLEAMSDPVLVLLGEPGAGKTTLLRQLELAEARAGLDGRTDRVAFAASLAAFGCELGERRLPEPERWLAEGWAARGRDLPPLSELKAAGRMLLLLDGLNEMPVRSLAERREAVEAWRRFAVTLANGPPGNRMVVSCRRLDYSQPLSSEALRVPQVQIEALGDDRVRAYLEARAPQLGLAAWQRLATGGQLAMLRTPYYLELFAAQLAEGRELPRGRAALMTAYVREALWREAELGLALLGEVVTEADRQRLADDRWADACELPTDGPLVAGLARLAHRMQEHGRVGEASQVRIRIEAAIAAVADPMADGILRAGEALNLLDRSAADDDVLFSHQLLQEYFAGREMARRGDVNRARRPWRVDDVRPRLADVVADLPHGDPVPPLPTTGWEETAVLATAMAPDADRFLTRLMAANLSLAGRSAAQDEIRARLSERTLGRLRAALVARSRDRDADLRERIACAYAVAELGDPRYERRAGPFGDYLMPPFVTIPAGRYPIGDDEPIHWQVVGDSGVEESHLPRHVVALAEFAIGRFPVTNAEYACFMAAGGYDDARWWPGDAERWRRGELPEVGGMNLTRLWRDRFGGDPTLLDHLAAEGRFATPGVEARWRAWMAMDDAAFEAAIAAHHRGKRLRQPAQWSNSRFNHPSQPAVGITWFEARAYCAWLAAQTGRDVRLPSEVEWEAAARGAEARRYASGNAIDPLRFNLYETGLRQTTPPGVFVEGDTPDGISDMTGNVMEWTGSVWGTYRFTTSYPYPYDALDGREDPAADATLARVARGGHIFSTPDEARASFRHPDFVDLRYSGFGFRLAITPPAG